MSCGNLSGILKGSVKRKSNITQSRCTKPVEENPNRLKAVFEAKSGNGTERVVILSFSVAVIFFIWKFH